MSVSVVAGPRNQVQYKKPSNLNGSLGFVFAVEPSPQQNQWLSFVGSNHPQPIAVGITTVGERR